MALNKIHKIAEECQALNLDKAEDYAKLLENQDKMFVLEKEIEQLNRELKAFNKAQKRKHLRLLK
jgi:hypothetical protein